MTELKLRRLPDGSGRLPPLPAYQTEGAAACDLCAFLSAPLELAPGARALVPTGIAAELPAGACALLFARSGLAARHGLALANGVGLIDNDYRGEIRVALVNLGSEPFTVRDGERIAQLMVMQPQICTVCECSELSDTARGAGGFGSTGR